MSKRNTPIELKRGLEQRHITLMSLGAAIGVGLFLGSATSIKLAGPGILLSYALGGLAIFFIMRALGEMAVHNPVAGSFSQYAHDYLGPLAGYITGWNYWFMWIITCMAEITAVGIYMEYWFSNVPQWIWALTAVVMMTAINFMTVKLYGEFEFWFALIKVVTILLMIAAGLGMIFFGIGNGGIATGIENLWIHGGFFANGFSGVFMALPMVMFAYAGIEMIGVTAGEAKNPEKSLPKAIDTVFWRILIFYVGSLFVIMSIYPWNDLGTGSPFVMTFTKTGIPGAAGILNFVVLTAALSSCNSGIFSTGRMLFNLAHQGEAPAKYGRLSKAGIPSAAVLASSGALLIGVVLNYLAPAEVFIWLTSIAAFGSVWTWTIILLSQIQFRKSLSREEQKKLSYKMPFFPYSSVLILIFMSCLIGIIGFSPAARAALLIGPLWYGNLIAFYYWKKAL